MPYHALMQFDGTNINFFIAFVSGLVTFFASCLLPLVPIYLSYLSGVSLSVAANKKSRFTILKTSIFFVIGFIATFVILGATFMRFAQTINVYRIWVERLGGILFIMFGLYMTGLLRISSLSKQYQFKASDKFKQYRSIHAILTGVIFGFAWSPCIGPVLGVILFWASRQATQLQGLALLVVYGLGLGLPFILVGLGFEKLVPLLKRAGKLSKYIQVFLGIIVIFAGVLLIMGEIQNFSSYLIDFFGLRSLSR